MGIAMGLLSKGLSHEQVTDRMYKKLVEDGRMDSYEEFHIAMLQALNMFNLMVPGVHYEAPMHAEVKIFHEKWEGEKDEIKKKELFKQFMDKCKSKSNKSTMYVGLVAPPASMIFKRTCETIPQVKKISLIPDFVFVPGATMLALGGLKLYNMNTTMENASNPKPNE